MNATTEPRNDEVDTTVEPDPAEQTIRVVTRRTPTGLPVEHVDADGPTAAQQWDERLWGRQ